MKRALTASLAPSREEMHQHDIAACGFERDVSAGGVRQGKCRSCAFGPSCAFRATSQFACAVLGAQREYRETANNKHAAEDGGCCCEQCAPNLGSHAVFHDAA